MREAIINFPFPALRWPLRLLGVAPLGATGLMARDRLGKKWPASM